MSNTSKKDLNIWWLPGWNDLDIKDRNTIRWAFKIGVLYTIVFTILGSLVKFDILKTIGAYVVLKALAEFRWFVKKRYMKKTKNITAYGKWAIVTGCTSGLGKEYARILAKKGLNVLLISRTMSKLQELKQIIAEESPAVETAILAHDYDCTEEQSIAFFKKLEETLDGFEAKNETVGVLINNVGLTGTNIPERLLDTSFENTRGMLRVNIMGTVYMTRHVLPYMLKHKSGAILNVSSGSGLSPQPLLSIYSSTKAFMNQWSETISYEYKSQGIDITVITPYYFVSNLFKRQKGQLIAPEARVIAENSLNLLGREFRAFGYWVHCALYYLYILTPGIEARFRQKSEEARARCLKKLEQQN